MKLNFLFFVMDQLTVLAYPIVFVHGKLHRFSRPEEVIPSVILLVLGPAKLGRSPPCSENRKHLPIKSRASSKASSRVLARIA